ncbi:phospholipase C [Arthrobacter ginsengisoli]|uniref:Phospholipase C n=1 Tax=Arthrobacter ginsengisoli TaxID=1356565 RepID=A0ABU1U6G1_9MICC|nr:alkaline phosphatase family protein [Arthrobacter ginsengisoli]MDR7080773.1 phospholipase C [Arthrobacter ginsengisoli]
MRRVARPSLAVVLALGLAGCIGPEPAPDPSPSASLAPPSQPATGTPVPSGPARQGTVDHVVIIVMENKVASRILGADDAPYLNSLAKDYALAANYHAVTRPSLPNYLALTSGTTAGITSNCDPAASDCQARVRTIADEITETGRVWRMYAEGMPEPCMAGNSGRYAVKHNPFMYYPSVTGDRELCTDRVVPFSRLDEDLKTGRSLPDYVFITPDMCSDTHDCPVRTGDDWLSRQVPKILAAPAFSSTNSLLVVTYDEGSGSSNHVATVFAGPAARKGYVSETRYTHYSLLRTIEDAWGLDPLTDNDRGAAGMAELLN